MAPAIDLSGINAIHRYDIVSLHACNVSSVTCTDFDDQLHVSMHTAWSIYSSLGPSYSCHTCTEEYFRSQTTCMHNDLVCFICL